MAYSLFVLPLGEIDEDALEHIRHVLHTTFRIDVQLLKGRPTPFFAYSDFRHQFSAPAIIRRIAGLAEHKDAKILAVTAFDIFAPRTNFVFGEAQISGPAAVISLYRLIDEDRNIYLKRAGKEAVHEIGHTFGLDHCDKVKCVMSFSHDIVEADAKPETFCRRDKEQLDLILHQDDRRL
jgi:archaemetzincin